MRNFFFNEIGNREYTMAIVSDNYKNVPTNITEEHQEMLIIDLYCSENLPTLLNEVWMVPSELLSNY